jgi:hypothetical protein
MSRVFVVCNNKRVADGGGLVATHDIEPARTFGELVELLGPNTRPFPETQNVVEELHQKLADFRQNDYLLLIGNPCLIGMATAIAANYSGGVVNMLQWNGRNRGYIPVRADLASN